MNDNTTQRRSNRIESNPLQSLVTLRVQLLIMGMILSLFLPNFDAYNDLVTMQGVSTFMLNLL